MSTASRGAAREHAVKRLLEDEGYAVTRGAGSHGCADLWAAKGNEDGTTFLYLIQVKGNAGSPYMHFRGKEREALMALADQTGGMPALIHWPPRGTLRWHYEDSWPRVKVAA
jgi:Holliday junction resolvase